MLCIMLDQGAEELMNITSPIKSENYKENKNKTCLKEFENVLSTGKEMNRKRYRLLVWNGITERGKEVWTTLHKNDFKEELISAVS